jgi:hypothetical protein
MRNLGKHNKELFDLCRLPCIVSLVKCRRLCWAGHVTGNGETRHVFIVSVLQPFGKWQV